MPTRFEVEVRGATLVGERHDVGDWYGTGIDREADRLPLVLLHPGVGDRRTWHRVVPTWSTASTVIAYDRRGFGESDWFEVEHDAVDDLFAVLDDQAVPRAVLVGSSMGGLVAMLAALRRPDRVAGLLLIAPAVTGAPPPVDVPEHMVAMEQAAEDAAERGDLDEANRLDANVWLDGPDATRPRVDAKARELFLEMNARALAAPSTGTHVDQPDVWPRLDELTMPVHVVVGALDLPYLADWGRQVAAAAGGSFDLLPNVAHLPQLEAHQRFLAATAGFLEHVR